MFWIRIIFREETIKLFLITTGIQIKLVVHTELNFYTLVYLNLSLWVI